MASTNKNSVIFDKVAELLRDVVIDEKTNNEDAFILISNAGDSVHISIGGAEIELTSLLVEAGKQSGLRRAMNIAVGYMVNEEDALAGALINLVLKKHSGDFEKPTDDENCDCAICTRKREERAEQIANNTNIN